MKYSRSNSNETVISVIILLVLVLIAMGVFVKQLKFDMTEFGLTADLDTIKDPISTTIDVSTWAALTPMGFRPYLKPETYSPDTLYEKIDGKAPLYLDAGFFKLFSGRFAGQDNEQNWLEVFIYEMVNQKGAFSVYSTQKRADAVAFEMKNGLAYRTANSLNFSLGQYYVEIIASSDFMDLDDAMSSILGRIESEVFPNIKTDIPELSLMVHKTMIPGSIKLYLKNAFGSESLTNTFSAEYQLENFSVIGFISIQLDAMKAEEVMESYYQFLLEYEGERVESDLDSPIRVVTLLDAFWIVFHQGRCVAGVHEAPTQAAAEKVAGILMENLSTSTE